MKQLGEYFVNENIGRLHFFNINKKDQIFGEEITILVVLT